MSSTLGAGLSQAEVDARVERGQANRSDSRTSRSVGDILRANIFTRFNALLLTLAVIVIAVDRSVINALFGAVMIFNSGIGIVQELRAKRTLDKLAIVSAPRAHARRGGVDVDIPTEDVVLDDILELRLGDQVPADGEVLETFGLEIDESLLTGESDPIHKRLGDPVLSGSIVVAGAGTIRVTAVGSDAYAYRISDHAKRFQQAHSELLAGTNTLLKWISWMLILIAPLLVWGQLRIAAGDWRGAILSAAAAIVGMIPEGLVLLTSMAFMLATVALARRKVLVQQLPAVEGLARVDMLLLDKTGTLTEGSIRFEALVEVDDADRAAVTEALATMAGRGTSPTNDAIREALAGTAPAPVLSEVPFSSERKWSAVTIASGHWLLGAPEVLFAGVESPMAQSAARIAAEGKRVLAVMSCDAEPDAATLPAGRRPRALVVLTERIRPDAAETLRYFAMQGVAIKVISGDSPLTVGAVARAVGLAGAEPFDARQLPEAGPELTEILASHDVFGRVRPEQKRQIAAALQAAGHTVAMTGDGVNDALALKDADLGIAMNSGAQATKAVAELVLLDNKFSHLPKVLAEGRRVIANIERVANLFVIKNVYSLVLSLCVTVAGLPYPFVPSQMTVISALTIGIPAFFLALAPNAQRYRPGFLRRVLSFALPVGVIVAAAMMANYSFARAAGLPDAAASTSTSIVTVSIGACVLILLSRPVRGWKIALIAAVTGAFVALLALPWTRSLLSYEIDWRTISFALALAAAGCVLVWLVWRFDRRRDEARRDEAHRDDAAKGDDAPLPAAKTR